MKQKILIHQKQCKGCANCVKVCPNQAIQLINGKAHLIHEKSCNVFGKCIAFCPNHAIEIVEKQTYCVGDECSEFGDSELYNWPVQISGVNICNYHLPESDLLIAADCCAYAYADFHNDFIRDHVTLIACPKNDLSHQLVEKMTLLFEHVPFHSIQVVAMNAQCCFPLLEMVREAIQKSGCKLTVSECVLSPDGEVFR